MSRSGDRAITGRFRSREAASAAQRQRPSSCQAGATSQLAEREELERAESPAHHSPSLSTIRRRTATRERLSANTESSSINGACGIDGLRGGDWIAVINGAV